MDIQPIASSTVEGPTELKQQIHQLVEQLPVEALPDMLHFSAKLLNGSQVNGSNEATPIQSSSFSESSQTKQPWLPSIERLKDSPFWDEFEEAIAEYRRELDAENEVL